MELTTIMTIQVTKITKGMSEEEVNMIAQTNSVVEKALKNAVELAWDADDVNLKMQHFARKEK